MGQHRTIYALDGSTIELPPGAAWRPPTLLDYRITSAYIPEGTLETLPVAISIIRTICPWLEHVHAGPGLWRMIGEEEAAMRMSHNIRQDRHGRPWARTCGVAHDTAPESITLALDVTTVGLITTALHECFHIISPHLSSQAHRVLEQHTSTGYDWHDPYHRNPEERKARLFESWAHALLEGWQPRPFILPQDGSLCLESIFDGIYSGEIGKKIQQDMEKQAAA
ncbi:hypothetical protein [Fodinicurvata fenggangensis]|uniref:hypothetical protein n=1 Tax=Fodinicurvata fenggangensis TaxID=1121830 RepID=UPI00047C4A65|nr:hypothetical protein [Fodinicurvata fenggangensis]